MHLKRVAAASCVKPISQQFAVDTDLQTIRAEVAFSNFLVEHNIPLSAADHAGSLFRVMFPDSKYAKNYGCARTKTSNIVKVLADDDEQALIQCMREGPFSIATDGSNDFEDVKLYPLVVRFFNASQGRVVCLLLHLLESSVSTGEAIYKLMVDYLAKHNIPWTNCLSFAADIAKVMVGTGVGVAGHLRRQHPHVCVIGCACHLIHIAAEKASSNLRVNVEDILIKIWYYLDKSSKRKTLLKELQKFHSVENRKTLKHVSTRWLSLGQCTTRLVEQWEPLAEFFKEEDAKTRRDGRSA